MKTHYDTLGVSKNATKAEVKAAFRKLSLQTHPDVAAGTANVERFKQISEAHRVLSNDVERRIYDLEIVDPFRSELRRNRGFTNAAGTKPSRHHPSFMHAFFDGLGRPRNIALGLTVGVSAMMAFNYAFSSTKHPVTDRPALVEAWFNPQTRQYEPPAPWDPTYKKIKPTLELVPRKNVRHRPSY